MQYNNGTLLIHLVWYELPWGTCRSDDLSVAPTRGEEYDARDTTYLYKNTMREDAMKFSDPLANIPAATK